MKLPTPDSVISCTVGTTGFVDRYYSICGSHIRVRFDDPSLCRTTQGLFEAFAEDLSGKHNRVDLHIHFAAADRLPPLPSTARTVARRDTLRVLRDRGVFLVKTGGFQVEVRPLERKATVLLGTSESGEAVVVRSDLFLYCLLILFRHRGLYALHAAGVARDGLGCLFVGDCCSGKSTLSFGLVRNGWNHLADDVVVLRFDCGVEAFRVETDLRLDPQSAPGFPDLESYGRGSYTVGAISKQNLDLRRLYPDQLVTHCKPGVLFFPRIVPDSRSQLNPLEKTEGLLRLIQHSQTLILIEPELAHAQIEVLKQLINQARCYELLGGRDLIEEPTAIARLLSSVLESEEAITAQC